MWRWQGLRPFFPPLGFTHLQKRSERSMAEGWRSGAGTEEEGRSEGRERHGQRSIIRWLWAWRRAWVWTCPSPGWFSAPLSAAFDGPAQASYAPRESFSAPPQFATAPQPVWPELLRSCGYSPPRFFPAPPASIFLPPRWTTWCHVSARTGYRHRTTVHTHTQTSNCLAHALLLALQTLANIPDSLVTPQRSLFSLSHMWHSSQSPWVGLKIQKLQGRNELCAFYYALPLVLSWNN